MFLKLNLLCHVLVQPIFLFIAEQKTKAIFCFHVLLSHRDNVNLDSKIYYEIALFES